MTTDRQDPETFASMLEGFSPEVAAVARAARQYVLDFMPGAYEIVWPKMKAAGYGTGPKKMTEHFAWITPYRAHAVMGFYYGAELPDPHGLLEGTGAKMRHIKLRTAADLSIAGLRELLIAASKHRVPPLREDAAADLAAARKAAIAPSDTKGVRRGSAK